MGFSYERIPPCTGGIDQDSPPDRLAKDKCRKLQNLLTHQPGLTVVRGNVPKNQAVVTTAPATAYPMSPWVGRRKAVVGFKDFDAAGVRVREPWTTPYRPATNANQLAYPAQGGGGGVDLSINEYDLAPSPPTVTDHPGSLMTPGPIYTRSGDFMYGISYGLDQTTDEVTQNGSVHKLTNMLRFGVDIATLGASDYVGNAPRGSQGIKLFANRLFLLGGLEPNRTHGTSTCGPGTATAAGTEVCQIMFNTLWFSIPVTQNTLLPGAAASWQDPVTGKTNRIDIPTPSPNDTGVALAAVGQSLLVLNRSSLFIVHGYSPSTFTVRNVSRNVGCLDPRSVVEVEGGVFFMSDQGFMFFDGSQVRKVSRGLDTTMLADAVELCGDNGIDGGAIEAIRLPGNYIMITVSQQPFHTSGTYKGDWRGTYLYHIDTNSWSEFASPLFLDPADGTTHGGPLVLGGSAQDAIGIDTTSFVRLRYITTPENTTVSATDNVAKDYNASNTGTAFVARLKTRLLNLVQPWASAVLHRFSLDYRATTAAAGVSNMWAVTLLNDSNRTVLSSTDFTTLSGSTSDTAAGEFIAGRRRTVAETFAETASIQAQIDLTVPADADQLQPGGAALYEAGVEFSATNPAHRLSDVT